MKSVMFLVLILILPEFISAQSSEKPESHFQLKGYGTFNYQQFDWQTDPEKRAEMDLEKLVLYPTWVFNLKLSAHAEIEFEHGGTGSTMEFDKLEEFGEFEQEIEKGGEVVLEQMYIRYEFASVAVLKAGWIKIPIGLASTHDEPKEYFTTTVSEFEAALVPVNWYEGGISLSGSLNSLTYSLMVVNGLDATGFSSANWIRNGYQRRFEKINAEDLAVFARVDYGFTENLAAGVSWYRGNSTGNRPKPDMKADAVVQLADVHSTFESDSWILRGMVLYGTLSNADLVTKANKNLSNNLNVKRTPVASAALAWSVEAGYDLLAFLQPESQKLYVFGKQEFYDSMYKTTGVVFDNPRFERRVTSFGLHYLFQGYISVKTQYAMRTIGTPSENQENTFSVGIGFEFE